MLYKCTSIFLWRFQCLNKKLGQFDEKPAFLGCFSKRSTHIFGCHTSKTTISFSRIWLEVDFWRPKLCEISFQICNLKKWTPDTFKFHFSVLFLLCFHARLFIDALWPLLGKGWPLCSRLWCLIAFQSVSWVRCGLDCIDSWSLPSFLLSCISLGQHP